MPAHAPLSEVTTRLFELYPYILVAPVDDRAFSAYLRMWFHVWEPKAIDYVQILRLVVYRVRGRGGRMCSIALKWPWRGAWGLMWFLKARDVREYVQSERWEIVCVTHMWPWTVANFSIQCSHAQWQLCYFPFVRFVASADLGCHGQHKCRLQHTGLSTICMFWVYLRQKLIPYCWCMGLSIIWKESVCKNTTII